MISGLKKWTVTHNRWADRHKFITARTHTSTQNLPIYVYVFSLKKDQKDTREVLMSDERGWEKQDVPTVLSLHVALINFFPPFLPQLVHWVSKYLAFCIRSLAAANPTGQLNWATWVSVCLYVTMQGAYTEWAVHFFSLFSLLPHTEFPQAFIGICQCCSATTTSEDMHIWAYGSQHLTVVLTCRPSSSSKPAWFIISSADNFCSNHWH